MRKSVAEHKNLIGGSDYHSSPGRSNRDDNSPGGRSNATSVTSGGGGGTDAASGIGNSPSNNRGSSHVLKEYEKPKYFMIHAVDIARRVGGIRVEASEIPAFVVED